MIGLLGMSGSPNSFASFLNFSQSWFQISSNQRALAPFTLIKFRISISYHVRVGFTAENISI